MRWSWPRDDTSCCGRTVFPDAFKLLQEGRMIGSESSMRYYHPIQDLINDKGIIWIRHGPPTKIAHNSTGPAFEIWRYERPEGALVLYFRQADFEGSSMPNELVPTLLDASPVILQQLCDLDTPLCPHTLSRGADYAAPLGGRDAQTVAKAYQAEVRAAGPLLTADAVETFGGARQVVHRPCN